ncbi:hypothetical protein ACHAWU_001394 [Discostella pseudostelligera]|uniref:Pyridoxamine 5'-phosphate oxidase putative domain-containing protein n=1 Tax=Discostella pseudostelligera TaxID=259834 RepID=A0ABD3M740_9STRA
MTAITDNTTTTPRIHASSSIISFALFLCPIVYTVTKRHQRRVQEGARRTEREAERAFLSSIVSSREQGSLRPPLPAIVRQSLSRRRLAYLGTVTSSSAGGGVPCPHLSLMRFTYLPEEDAILMSTNVYTKKYDMLSAGAAGGGDGGEGGALVALLVHDFADSSHFSSHSSSSSSLSEEANNSGGGMYSITLNGTCSVVKDVLLAENYRQIHLKNNPDYPQFIVGDNIAMLRVDVISARICNIKDEVIKWNVVDG